MADPAGSTLTFPRCTRLWLYFTNVQHVPMKPCNFRKRGDITRCPCPQFHRLKYMSPLIGRKIAYTHSAYGARTWTLNSLPLWGEQNSLEENKTEGYVVHSFLKNLKQGQTLSVKDQLVNILGFVGHIVSVTTMALSCCSTKAGIEHTVCE